MADVVASSELAMSATWLRDHPPADPVGGEASVLPGGRDNDLQIAKIRSSKDARKIRVRIGQSWAPAFGDQVTIDETTWTIRTDPTLDRRGLFWLVDLAR